MRILFIVAIVCIALLGGFIGYTVGINWDTLSRYSLESGTSSNEITDPKKLPLYDSLLITANTDPLPLNLQAGLFYSYSMAEKTVKQLNDLGYKAYTQQFRDKTNDIINVAILEPFQNESKLQLARYELLNQHNIVTQRILTPPEPESADQ